MKYLEIHIMWPKSGFLDLRGLRLQTMVKDVLGGGVYANFSIQEVLEIIARRKWIRTYRNLKSILMHKKIL